MTADDIFSGDEPIHDAEPEPWRPPVRCPQCHGEQTRFLTLHHEMSVYQCEVCGVKFEIEEPL